MAVAEVLVIFLAWTSVLGSAPSMTLYGSVDKSEANWGEVQKFQFKLALPTIPATLYTWDFITGSRRRNRSCRTQRERMCKTSFFEERLKVI